MRRQEQAAATKDSLLVAAERLFAEHGVRSVTHRQITEAAGQANNAAITYYFGTTDDLLVALVRRHADAIGRTRVELIEAVSRPGALADWLSCLVLPVFRHLEDLGVPSHYARFTAQMTADPTLHRLVVDAATSDRPSLSSIGAGIRDCLPHLDDRTYDERLEFTRQLTIHTAAERERALAAGHPTRRPDWRSAADGLLAALEAMWRAPLPT